MFGEKSHINYTKMNQEILINLIFKCIKLAAMTANTCYFTGMVWFILCDLNDDLYVKASGGKSFISEYYWIWDRPNYWEHALANAYFALTTMSTVGFGDLTP